MSTSTTPTITRRAYTVADLCHDFSIGRTKCNELMRDGIFETRHVGRRVLITAESAEAWWASLEANKLRRAA